MLKNYTSWSLPSKKPFLKYRNNCWRQWRIWGWDSGPAQKTKAILWRIKRAWRIEVRNIRALNWFRHLTVTYFLGGIHWIIFFPSPEVSKIRTVGMLYLKKSTLFCFGHIGCISILPTLETVCNGHNDVNILESPQFLAPKHQTCFLKLARFEARR
jgi:hypothetical protein